MLSKMHKHYALQSNYISQNIKKTIFFYGPTEQNETAVQGLQVGIGSAATCASFYCYYNIIVILVTHV